VFGLSSPRLPLDKLGVARGDYLPTLAKVLYLEFFSFVKQSLTKGFKRNILWVDPRQLCGQGKTERKEVTNVATPMRTYNLPRKIWDKPIALDPDTGKSVTLRDAINLTVDWLDALEGEQLSRLVIERLQLEETREVWILGGVFTLEEVIEAVRKGSEVGQLFIKMEKLHVADLRQNVQTGRFVIE